LKKNLKQEEPINLQAYFGIEKLKAKIKAKKENK
jgi:hypothetical protein